MSTPRDLLIVALDVPPARPLQPGDLSLALAGAEAVDLLRSEVTELDGGRIVPRLRTGLGDPLLDEAAASLKLVAPYESLEDWLWRRGRGLSERYLAALEEEGQITWRRSRWLPLSGGHRVLGDTEARRRALARWTADDPVIVALAAAIGVREEADTFDPGPMAEAELTVVAAVHDAVTELAAVRRRRAIEDAAFANVWRGA
ncbi:GPP34 family phosphoprotein [Streptomyces sp. NPDC046831]|uniref:GOLPH3/VPS74 family protein n=1 Tax=Streptomyces sp. NPDC046831 TaxID=3154805 RepID=UPI0033CB96EB